MCRRQKDQNLRGAPAADIANLTACSVFYYMMESLFPCVRCWNVGQAMEELRTVLSEPLLEKPLEFTAIAAVNFEGRAFVGRMTGKVFLPKPQNRLGRLVGQRPAEREFGRPIPGYGCTRVAFDTLLSCPLVSGVAVQMPALWGSENGSVTPSWRWDADVQGSSLCGGEYGV